MEESQDWPITGVVVVADPTKCPAGFSIIDKTFDRREEADLWRDGLFGRRVTRFLCVERSAPQLGKDVLVDVVIIQDKDPVPAGFTVVDCTNDTIHYKLYIVANTYLVEKEPETPQTESPTHMKLLASFLTYPLWSNQDELIWTESNLMKLLLLVVVLSKYESWKKHPPVDNFASFMSSVVFSREKAVKRKLLCIRWMSCALTNDAISEIIFLSKGAKRPPNLYNLVGELSNLVLCYRMTPIKAPQNSQPTSLNMANLKINLPYSMNPTQESVQQQGTYARQGRADPPERSMSSLLLLSVTPLSDVPWQLNPKISSMNNLRNFKIPEIRCKTMLDIEREYDYAFNVEKETKKAS